MYLNAPAPSPSSKEITSSKEFGKQHMHYYFPLTKAMCIFLSLVSSALGPVNNVLLMFSWILLDPATLSGTYHCHVAD